MIKIGITLLVFIFIGGCSFKAPVNEWQHKSTTAFNLYSKNFLSDNTLLAKNDLHRSVEHAKKSANLTQLAKIYLGECALNISAGVDDSCSKYKDIADLVDSKELTAYYNFILLDFNQTQVKYLPENYQNFATFLLRKDFKSANEELLNMQRTSSSLLSAALVKEHLSNDSRSKIIKLASLHGYKKVVLFWLEESRKYTKNIEILKKLNKKISVLTKNK